MQENKPIHLEELIQENPSQITLSSFGLNHLTIEYINEAGEQKVFLILGQHWAKLKPS